MLFKTSFVLLATWLLGVLDVYSVGNVVHLLLLVGLMLALVATLRMLDGASGNGPDRGPRPG
jgi:Family of unknown function (DUF5670)